jgi:hypothetical protein
LYATAQAAAAVLLPLLPASAQWSCRQIAESDWPPVHLLVGAQTQMLLLLLLLLGPQKVHPAKQQQRHLPQQQS